MAYYYYAETSLVYLFSKARQHRLKTQEKYFGRQNHAIARHRDRKMFDTRKNENRLIYLLRIVFVASVLFGSLKEAGIIWSLGDMGVGMMAWINIIAILLLSPKAFKALKSYERQKKEGKEPVFDPKEIGAKGADFWESRHEE
jgi:Na+/alanine symporter